MLNGYGQQQYDQYGLPVLNSLVKKKDNQYTGYSYDTGNAAANTTPEANKMAEVNVKTPEKLKKDNDEGGFLGSITSGLGSIFKPSGENGASTFGSVMGGLGTAFDIYQGLGSLKLAKEEAKLNKEIAAREAAKEARLVQAYNDEEARKVQLAQNAGNGAFYK